MWMINIAGLLLIAFIVWWFWLYKPKETELEAGGQPIVVDDGVYQPARIKVHADEPTTLRFMRKDASPCAEMVLFPEQDISVNLPLNKTQEVKLPSLKAGTYPFHCQMQMYRGELVVE